ncbi:PREDICTED: uncharacterized protein LOC105448737 [Wasmannia auropunctata]|uniref:uncharacterized protein LOC105448737 n=1 Tax=Wasmannia auropunctata TaxID=64793 RepID=UPI0005F03998|nr:PREDICTED: uncharacterized protein LOC105448737 [Wasmannia auropunctata]
MSGGPDGTGGASARSYVEAASSGCGNRITPKLTSLIVTPREDASQRFTTSDETKMALQRAIKPSDYNLKVKRVTSVKNNGVRVEALSVDLPKIRESAELRGAGLRLVEEKRANPRLLIRGVLFRLSGDDIRSELITLNLRNFDPAEVKVTHVYTPTRDRGTTSCVIEVTPGIRSFLLAEGQVFISFSACSVSDFVRVLQCYKCLAFGHMAKNCKFDPLCGHCAGDHETRACTAEEGPPVCGNCRRWTSRDERHSALDGGRCPVLQRRRAERVRALNNG